MNSAPEKLHCNLYNVNVLFYILKVPLQKLNERNRSTSAQGGS